MKKLLIILLLVPLVSFSQKWEAVSTVDRFGDATGETLNQIMLKGTFSNSATANSEARVYFTDYGQQQVQIKIIEYTDNQAVFLDDWVDLYIKKASDGKTYGRKYISRSDVLGMLPNFKFGAKVLYTAKVTDKKWARYVKKGKEKAYSFSGLLRGLVPGDKINIVTESGSDYNFEVQ